jgi:beta-alanine degradation protein BauB
MDPDWPEWLKQEFADNQQNGEVGAKLLLETEQARVWFILLDPGERLPVHKHVLNYLWTVTHPGRSRSHYHNGETIEADYSLGQTVQHDYSPGEYMMHDLENVGSSQLGFTTVEFLDSSNRPLSLAKTREAVMT